MYYVISFLSPCDGAIYKSKFLISAFKALHVLAPSNLPSFISKTPQTHAVFRCVFFNPRLNCRFCSFAQKIPTSLSKQFKYCLFWEDVPDVSIQSQVLLTLYTHSYLHFHLLLMYLCLPFSPATWSYQKTPHRRHRMHSCYM